MSNYWVLVAGQKRLVETVPDEKGVRVREGDRAARPVKEQEAALIDVLPAA